MLIDLGYLFIKIEYKKFTPRKYVASLKLSKKIKHQWIKKNLRSAKRQRVSADATAFRERSKVDLAKKKQAQQDIQAAATGFIDKVNL